MIKRIFLLIFILMLTSCTKEKKPTEPPLVLRYADVQAEGYPTTKAARYFAALVKEKSEGRLEVEVFPDSALGNEPEVLKELLLGGIDLGRFSVATLEILFPEFKPLVFPYVFRDEAHMWAVVEGKTGKDILASIKGKGAVGLCWFEAGARSFYFTKRVTSFDDLEGKRIRIPENKTMADCLSAFGVTTIEIPFSAVYSALEAGKIDGAENNMPSFVSMGHDKPAPYVFLDEHQRIPELVLMSESARKEVLELFGEEMLAIIDTAAAEASTYERKLWKEYEETCLQDLAGKGMTTIIPTAEEKAKAKARMDAILSSLQPEVTTVIKDIQMY